MAYPSTRGWGERGCGDSRRLWVPGPYPASVRSEVYTIFDRLTRDLQRVRVAAGRPSLSSSGGCNVRYIAGTTTWSNHSWGLAIDLNAPANPYSYTRITDFPVAATQALATRYGMRWGYNYSRKFDPMHFEYMGTPADARVLTAELEATSTPGRRLTDEEMGKVLMSLEVVVIGDTDGEYSGWPVSGAQFYLFKRGFLKTFADVDGVFGPGTKAAVQDFQRSKDLVADGEIGPRTWDALVS